MCACDTMAHAALRLQQPRAYDRSAVAVRCQPQGTSLAQLASLPFYSGVVEVMNSSPPPPPCLSLSASLYVHLLIHSRVLSGSSLFVFFKGVPDESYRVLHVPPSARRTQHQHVSIAACFVWYVRGCLFVSVAGCLLYIVSDIKRNEKKLVGEGTTRHCAQSLATGLHVVFAAPGCYICRTIHRRSINLSHFTTRAHVFSLLLTHTAELQSGRVSATGAGGMGAISLDAFLDFRNLHTRLSCSPIFFQASGNTL